MNVKKGTFTAATGTGDQTVSGIGFTPKAVMIWTSYQTAAGFTDGYLFQIGMSDGTRQNSAYSRTDDNTSPNDCDTTRSNTQICLVRNVAGTNVRVGTLSSFGSGQFVLNWTTVDSAVIFHYIAFGGTDLSVHVDEFITSAGTGFVPIAGFSFTPIAAILVQVPSISDRCNFPNIGWFTRNVNGTIGQGSFALNVEDAQATQDTFRYQRTVRCTSLLESVASTIFNDTSYTQLGFGLNTFSGSATPTTYFMVFGNISAYATSLLQPTATGSQAITGSGFTPKLLILSSVGQTAQTTVQANAKESFGAGDGSSQGWEYCGSNDAVNPSEAVGGHNTSNIVVMATPNATGASTTIQAEASLTSLDSDGFTLNWGTADATQREVIAFMIGDVISSGGGEHSSVF